MAVPSVLPAGPPLPPGRTPANGAGGSGKVGGGSGGWVAAFPRLPFRLVTLPPATRHPPRVQLQLTLERTIGCTSHRPATFVVNHVAGTVAWAAGCVVVVYDIARNRQVRFFLCRHPVTAIAFSRDGRVMAAGCRGRGHVVTAWDVGTGAVVAECLVATGGRGGLTHGVACLDFSADDRWLIVVGLAADRGLQVWDWRAASPRGRCVAMGRLSQTVHALSVSEAGGFFVTAGERHLKFWPMEPLAGVASASEGAPCLQLTSRPATLSEGGAKMEHFVDVACGQGAHVGRVYALTAAGILCSFDAAERLMDTLCDLRLRHGFCLDATSEGVLVGCADGVVRLFSPATLTWRASLPLPPAVGRLNVLISDGVLPKPMEGDVVPAALAARWAGGVRYAVVLYGDRSMFVWDCTNPDAAVKVRSTVCHAGPIWDIALYPCPKPQPAATAGHAHGTSDRSASFSSLTSPPTPAPGGGGGGAPLPTLITSAADHADSTQLDSMFSPPFGPASTTASSSGGGSNSSSSSSLGPACGQRLVLPEGTFVTASADCTLRFWNLNPKATSIINPTDLTRDPREPVTRGGGDDTAASVASSQPSAPRPRNLYMRELLTVLYVDDEDRAENGSSRDAPAPGGRRLYRSGTGHLAHQRYSVDAWPSRAIVNAPVQVEAAKPAGEVLEHSVRCLAVRPDGSHVACGDRQGNVRVFDVETGGVVAYEVAHDADVTGLSYTPVCGRLLASGSRDHLIHVFDVQSVTKPYDVVTTLGDHTASVTCVQFSNNDGQLISASSAGGILFTKMACAGMPLSPPGTGAEAGAGGGKSLATTITAIKQRYSTAPDAAAVLDCDVDAGNKNLITVGTDSRVHVWSLKSGRVVRSLKPEPECKEFNRVALDPAGLYAAAASLDRGVRVYDMFTGACIARAGGHSELVTGLVFTRDGRRLITVSADGCIFVWRLGAPLVAAIQQRMAEVMRVGVGGASLTPPPLAAPAQPTPTTSHPTITTTTIADGTAAPANLGGASPAVPLPAHGAVGAIPPAPPPIDARMGGVRMQHAVPPALPMPPSTSLQPPHSPMAVHPAEPVMSSSPIMARAPSPIVLSSPPRMVPNASGDGVTGSGELLRSVVDIPLDAPAHVHTPGPSPEGGRDGTSAPGSSNMAPLPAWMGRDGDGMHFRDSILPAWAKIITVTTATATTGTSTPATTATATVASQPPQSSNSTATVSSPLRQAATAADVDMAADVDDDDEAPVVVSTLTPLPSVAAAGGLAKAVDGSSEAWTPTVMPAFHKPASDADADALRMSLATINVRDVAAAVAAATELRRQVPRAVGVGGEGDGEEDRLSPATVASSDVERAEPGAMHWLHAVPQAVVGGDTLRASKSTAFHTANPMRASILATSVTAKLQRAAAAAATAVVGDVGGGVGGGVVAAPPPLPPPGRGAPAASAPPPALPTLAPATEVHLVLGGGRGGDVGDANISASALGGSDQPNGEGDLLSETAELERLLMQARLAAEAEAESAARLVTPQQGGAGGGSQRPLDAASLLSHLDDTIAHLTALPQPLDAEVRSRLQAAAAHLAALAAPHPNKP